MKCYLIDTWGLLNKMEFTSNEAANEKRKELNIKFHCIGRFWVRNTA